MEYKIALLGFGNVLRAFARLLYQKNERIEQTLGFQLNVVGIATNSRGIAIDPDGIDLLQALDLVKDEQSLTALHRGQPVDDSFAFTEQIAADVILEATWLDPQSGQPATDLVRTALQCGKHVVTANKGPVAYGYHELRSLAADHNLGFMYESTVMDGMPVHVVGREGLLALDIKRIRGILNSTTNSILTRLEEGMNFDDAVAEMQRVGLAEANPSNDIDGWDAAVKINVMANVLMNADLRPTDVDREGIRHITVEDAQSAVAEGYRIKLLCEAWRQHNQVKARVHPVRLPMTDPITNIRQTASAVSIHTDVLPEVTIIEGASSPTTTAYGMLVDTLNILRGRR